MNWNVLTNSVLSNQPTKYEQDLGCRSPKSHLDWFFWSSWDCMKALKVTRAYTVNSIVLINQHWPYQN